MNRIYSKIDKKTYRMGLSTNQHGINKTEDYFITRVSLTARSKLLFLVNGLVDCQIRFSRISTKCLTIQ